MSGPDVDEEWDDDWDGPTPGADGVAFDPAQVVVGLIVGVAGLLLFLQPSIRTLSVLGRDVPLFVLSGGVLSLGFALGAVVYFRRGARLVWVAHAIGAVGFGVLFAASGVGSLLFVWLGLAVVLGGVLFLATESRGLS
jgi:hypothetical protein